MWHRKCRVSHTRKIYLFKRSQTHTESPSLPTSTPNSLIPLLTFIPHLCSVFNPPPNFFFFETAKKEQFVRFKRHVSVACFPLSQLNQISEQAVENKARCVQHLRVEKLEPSLALIRSGWNFVVVFAPCQLLRSARLCYFLTHISWPWPGLSLTRIPMTAQRLCSTSQMDVFAPNAPAFQPVLRLLCLAHQTSLLYGCAFIRASAVRRHMVKLEICLKLEL